MLFRTLHRSIPSTVGLAAIGLIAVARDTHELAAPGQLASLVVAPYVTLAVGGTPQSSAVGRDAESPAKAYLVSKGVSADRIGRRSHRRST